MHFFGIFQIFYAISRFVLTFRLSSWSNQMFVKMRPTDGLKWVFHKKLYFSRYWYFSPHLRHFQVRLCNFSKCRRPKFFFEIFHLFWWKCILHTVLVSEEPDFGRKVVFALKMGLTPKNHPKWHFLPWLFGQRPFFSLNNFFQSWPEHG